MGDDGGYSEGSGGVISLGGQADNRDDGKTWGRQGVGIPPGGGGNGNLRTPIHKIVDYKAADNHMRKGGLPPHL